MADIFISYAREDREKAQPLAEALEQQGYSVWWDPVIPPGKRFDEVIEKALEEAKCVVVLWSKSSLKSNWVLVEAEEGRNRGILIPAFIEEKVRQPIAFRLLQAADLTEWDPAQTSPAFKMLLKGVSSILGPELVNLAAKRIQETADVEASTAEAEREEKEEKPAEQPAVVKADEEVKAPPETDVNPIPRWVIMIAGVVVFLVILLVILLLAGKWYKSYMQVSEVKNVQSKKRVSFELGKPKPPSVFTKSLGMEFVLIPKGTFMMGSPPDEPRRDDDETQHEVTISKPFYMQAKEVTQGQWRGVMGSNPSGFKDCGDECPVEIVSWNDVQSFIQKLNEMEGTDAYRLPTEAEWEYACRAGATTAFSFGDDVSKLDEHAWYGDNSEDQTHPVEEKKPNAWGLYDMHGNVWEWVEDDWHEAYDGAPADGSAWVDKKRGAYRVIRGGGWYFDARSCRSAHRSGLRPGVSHDGLGFRLSRSGTLGP